MSRSKTCHNWRNSGPVPSFQPLQRSKGNGMLYACSPLPSPGSQRWVYLALDTWFGPSTIYNWLDCCFQFLPSSMCHFRNAKGLSIILVGTPWCWVPCEHLLWAKLSPFPLFLLLINAEIVSLLFASANSWFEAAPVSNTQGVFYHFLLAFLCLKIRTHIGPYKEIAMVYPK